MKIAPQKSGRELHDDSPMKAGELATYMGIGRASVYRDRAAGYVFEFATRKITTPRHYKAWLREQAAKLNETSRTDREQVNAELKRLREYVNR